MTARLARWPVLLVICLLAFPVYDFARTGRQADAAASTIVSDGAHSPAVSPDGAQVAVGILGKIFLLPASGGQAREMTTGISWDDHPAWSPDGRFLAYGHQLPEGTDLVVYNFATGTSSIIYHTDASIGQIAFGPKGGEIFFLLDRNQYESHLWRVDANGGDPKQLTFTETWHEWSFALSPDGKQILIDSGKYGGSNLYLLDVDKLGTRRLTDTAAHQTDVNWTRDGRSWIYLERDNGVDSIMIEPAGGGASHRIFSSPYDEKQIQLFPNGASALVCAGRRLYRLDLESGQQTSIPFTARIPIRNSQRADLIITNATVFDATGRDPIPAATVEIRGGRIVSVSTNQTAAPAPPGVQVINAHGKFLLPGLMDSHYHYWTPFDGADLISRGITTIRDPGVSISTSVNFKQAIALGLLPGPDIYTCGPLIDGPNGYHPRVDVELSRPEAAAPLVRALKAQGVDALKVYFMLDPNVLRAVIKEAHAQGLRVTGHIGVRTGWREAMEAGIDGLNHIRVWRDFLPLDKQPQGDNETLDANTHMIPRMQADWSGIDPASAEAGSLIKLMLDKKIGFDPTLSIQRPYPEMRRRLSLEEYSRYLESYDKMGQFVARAQKAGVQIMAGTDDSNLFDELEAYAAAGIPNKDVLLSATVNGARWLGKDSEFGTIEPGKRANVVLVDGNPLNDIKDIRKVRCVIKDGRVVYESRGIEELQAR